MRLFSVIGEIVSIIIALVTIVERPGEGEKKREEVIDLFLERAQEHLAGLPKWAAGLFVRRSFIGWLIDAVVWVANTTGFFKPSEGPESA